jgi:transcriptional regulator with XRE-family HTH domain
MAPRPRNRDQALLDTFAKNVRRRREAKKISQEAFAAKVDLHRTYISHVERGKINLSLGHAKRIADGLGVGVDELLVSD